MNSTTETIRLASDSVRFTIEGDALIAEITRRGAVTGRPWVQRLQLHGGVDTVRQEGAELVITRSLAV